MPVTTDHRFGNPISNPARPSSSITSFAAAATYSSLIVLASLFISGCAADLAVHDVNVNFDNANRSAEATVTNEGNAPAGTFLVYFNADEFPVSQNHRPQVHETVTGLASGASVTLNADFAPLAHADNAHLANVYQVTVIADPKGSVAESDEDNNLDRAPTQITAVELFDRDDQLVPANPTPVAGVGQPVLFVHGHNLGSATDTTLNYRKNWQDPLDFLLLPDLPSFAIALAQPDNAVLMIEPYFLRLQDQNRSISEDAAAIGEAVARILQRHGDPLAATVKVAVIAYSKGSISSRWYLKHLMPARQPVSELIAISPPNHGLAAGGSLTAGSLAMRQLNNGYDDACVSFNEPASTDFIERLNGHPIGDSATNTMQASAFAGEAPSSRSNGALPANGVLYLAIYAEGNDDAVGGGTPSGDCQGRLVAKNLALDAENRELSIQGPTSLIVHAAAVHTPQVICLALYTALHHAAPPSGFACPTVSVSGRQVPIIPPSP